MLWFMTPDTHWSLGSHQIWLVSKWKLYPTEITKMSNDEMALAFAKQACSKKHRLMRYGLFTRKDGITCCIFDNDGPKDGLRDKELAEFRRYLQVNGIKEVGFATYPKSGKNAGHTTAILFETDKPGETFQEYDGIKEEWNPE